MMDPKSEKDVDVSLVEEVGAEESQEKIVKEGTSGENSDNRLARGGPSTASTSGPAGRDDGSSRSLSQYQIRGICLSQEIRDYKLFLEIVRQFPVSMTVDLQLAKSSLQSIAAYCEIDEIVAMIRSDDVLRIQMVRFLTKSTIAVLNPIKRELQSGGSTGILHDQEVLEAISSAFAALTNFFGVDSKMACDISTFTDLIQFLYPFWISRIYDPWEALPYGCLINITRNAAKCSHFLNSGHLKVQDLVKRSTEVDELSPQFPCLMDVLLNLSQVHEGRMQFFDRENEVLEKVVLRIKPSYPIRIRLAVAGILKNLAFEDESHHILVDESLDFLSYALRPLVGNGQYDEEDLNSLPALTFGDLIDNPELERDENPEVRHRTIEFLFRLCSDRKTRESLRSQNVYCILREYHKWETDKELIELTEQVVNLLIQNEEEIGVDSLSKLNIENLNADAQDKL